MDKGAWQAIQSMGSQKVGHDISLSLYYVAQFQYSMLIHRVCS